MKPYSPKTLAERWSCSSEHIRRMYHDGELSSIRLGKLIRIPATEVERIECGGSSSTEESIASPIPTRQEVALGPRLARLTYSTYARFSPRYMNQAAAALDW